MTYQSVPGVGFYPTDDQILGYLKERVDEHIRGCPNSSMSRFFPDIDIYQYIPWDIPPSVQSILGNPNQYKWYFLCPRNSTTRTVPGVGYWKVTGRKQDIVSADTGSLIGTKSILVFHNSSSGENGSWKVHEYHLSPYYLGYNINQMPFVACCLKKK